MEDGSTKIRKILMIIQEPGAYMINESIQIILDEPTIILISSAIIKCYSKK